MINMFAPIFIIFIVISVISAIVSALKKNPEVKKFFQDVKEEFSGKNNTYDRPDVPFGQRKPPSPKPQQKPPEKKLSFSEEADKARLKYTPLYREDMQTELRGNYDPIKMSLDEHTHPAESYGTIDDVYTGSMGVSYAGEGCEEHYNLKYISDNGQDESSKRLTTLQKLIVFGEVINTPLSRKRR